jgi:hypothetical protein
VYEAARIRTIGGEFPGAHRPGLSRREREESMAGFKDNNFSERRDAALKAKQDLLEKFKARPAADDPRLVKLAEERREIAEARAVRAVERERLRQEELVRQAELAAQRKIEEEARLLAEMAAAVAAEEAELELKNQQKAARDARYAARKARRR